MSNLVRSTRCRPSGDRSHRWITLMMIAAMFVFAGQVFAASGTPAKTPVPSQNAKQEVTILDADGNPTPAGDNSPLAPSAVLAAPPANDTCAGAIALQLNQAYYGTTVDANDDYQSPATVACFPGEGQFLTSSTGRDVVYSFTAPADGKYTFRSGGRYTSSGTYSQNAVMYLTDCANSGTVNCLKGGNSRYQQVNPGSKGQSNGLGESVDCFPMTSGQTTFLIFDDGPPGRCSDNNHTCVDDSYCAAGATCVPQINAGGTISVEVIPCAEEVEPNDSPATASAFSCGVTGASGVSPAAHCYLGTRNGNACTRPYANVSFLDQANPDSNMRCAGSGAMCVIDTTAGTDNCAAGTGPCQQQTDLDCDPRCDIGPNAGKSCSTHAFCNPVSDQGATCAGACIIENTCVDNVTGVDTGVACTPTCQGSTIPSVNGRVCASAANYDACPGGGVCTTTALAPQPGATCLTGQTCGRQFNEGDTDYYSIGSPAAGSKVFTNVWANNANDYDYRLRVTNATNTLQMDDNDAVSFFGGTASSVIGGAVTDGSPTYIAVSRTIPRTTKTYQVYATVRPPLAAAQAEDESGPNGNDLIYYWPANVINANPVSAGGYIRGNMNFPGDTDCFKILVNKGDLIDMYGDGGPGRGTGSVATVSDPFPLLYDAEPAPIANFVFGTDAKKNTAANVQGPGLRALSPAVTSAYVQWRSAYSGMLQVCYYDLRNFYPTSGPQSYPTPWAGSISVNCAPAQPVGPGTTTADVSITKTGPAGPVQTGQIVNYTITVTNNGTEFAQSVELFDNLDANLSFVGLSIDDTLGGNNTACFSLPTLGGNDAPIDCINTSMAPGSSTVYTLSVQVNNCIGGGITITNTADIIASDSTDPNPDNNSATTTFTTSEDGSCNDIICDADAGTCSFDLCTGGANGAGTCEAGVCVSPTVVCNDNSLCTDDTCDSAVGCVFDSSQAGDLCDDFNACTTNACDPIAFCVFPNAPSGTSCDDGLTCTSSDVCDGNGTCGGASICDDGNPCLDDFCDEGTHDCTHAPAFPGTACNDNNACTGTVAAGDVCDAAGLCTGGQTVDCNDNNACTDDSCDPGLGCVHTAVICDDGNACNGVESCDTATGCVGGVPVVCTASDQCHVAGTCDSGTGLCSNPAAADGTTCDDGNAATSGDHCTAGVCAGDACTSTNDPKSKGWYKGLCQNAHSGDSLTDADAACVGALTSTFSGISTVAQICAVLMPTSPNNDSCGKAEDQLMTLALNICKQRVCPVNAIDSACGNNGTVGQSLAESDAIFDNPSRTTATCNHAECLDKEINNGHALELDSLQSMREGTSIRLNWLPPYADDGQGTVRSYSIWRRAVGSKVPFVTIGTSTSLTYLDVNAASGSWEYDLTPNY
jgi:uncharacterized repeat protein (TIGR01451 family)